MNLLQRERSEPRLSPHHGAVLRDIQFDIALGETVALLGRSGCGKSTGADAGRSRNAAVWRCRLARRIADLPEGEAIGAFRRDIQLVFQDAISAVNPRKTVRDYQRAAAAPV